MAKKASEDHEAGLLVGTLDYIAPEIFLTRGDPRAYAAPCDMWALGIMMYQLFTGRNLVKRSNNDDTISAILKDRVSFNEPLWEKVSEDAKNLIRRLLEKKHQHRITA